MHEHEPLLGDAFEDTSEEEDSDPEPRLDSGVVAILLEVREQIVDTDGGGEGADNLTFRDLSL